MLSMHAHRGVLSLDELPEFGPRVLEVTRHPIALHLFVVARHQVPIAQLAAAASSGPLLDRIDIHVEVPRVEYEKLNDVRLGESSARLQARVGVARQLQRFRFVRTRQEADGASTPATGSSPHQIACNADMQPADVRLQCQLDDTCRALMRSAMNQLHLSAVVLRAECS